MPKVRFSTPKTLNKKLLWLDPDAASIPSYYTDGGDRTSLFSHLARNLGWARVIQRDLTVRLDKMTKERDKALAKLKAKPKPTPTVTEDTERLNALIADVRKQNRKLRADLAQMTEAIQLERQTRKREIDLLQAVPDRMRRALLVLANTLPSAVARPEPNDRNPATGKDAETILGTQDAIGGGKARVPQMRKSEACFLEID